MGTTHYKIGLLDGGVAPNVTPPHAVAEVLFRTVAATPAVREVLLALAADVTIEDVLESDAGADAHACRASTPPRSPT